MNSPAPAPAYPDFEGIPPAPDKPASPDVEGLIERLKSGYDDGHLKDEAAKALAALQSQLAEEQTYSAQCDAKVAQQAERIATLEAQLAEAVGLLEKAADLGASPNTIAAFLEKVKA